MYEENVPLTWKNTANDDITESDIEAISNFIFKNQHLIDEFVSIIYDDVVTECENGLRSMKYKFECSNIGFDGSIATSELENLEYVGDALTNFESDSWAIYPTLNLYGDNGWFNYKGIDFDDYIEYEIDDESNLDVYMTEASFNDIEKMHKDGEISDEDFEEIENWHSDMISKLGSEWDTFIADVNKLEEYFEDLLSLNSQNFVDDTLASFSVAFAFAPNGKVVDYEFNSEK